VPGRPPAAGKKLGGNFRNYSHIVEIVDGEVRYANATKAEPEIVTAFLQRAKEGTWYAAIAESGQKHTIPWAPPNPPGVGGVVAFDDQLISVPHAPDRWELLPAIESLLLLGVPRGVILDGCWTVDLVRKHGEALRAFDVTWDHERGGGFFHLTLHLAKNKREKRDAS
jgi:hypothetical protein